VSHPEDLLADYVDGTLDERARADVDTHLHGCERCRDEVRLAATAKAALVELEDRPVPFGVTGPVLAEAGRRFERRRGVSWERFQWAAGLAAAAALVVVVALNVGDRGSENTPSPAAAGTGATRATGAEAGDATASAPSLLRPRTAARRELRRRGDQAVVEAAGAVAAAAGGGRQGARERRWTRRNAPAMPRMRHPERAPRSGFSSASSRPSSRGHPPTSPCSPRVPAQASPPTTSSFGSWRPTTAAS
jgi:hypothetical protein